MNIKIDKSFQKDVKKIKERNIQKKIADIIRNVQRANNRAKIRNIKKLTGSSDEYRIKIGDYRIGLILSENNAEFIRCLHRKDIYKYFPK